MLFSDTFRVGGGGSPLTPLIAHAVGAVVGQLDVSTRSVTSGLA